MSNTLYPGKPDYTGPTKGYFSLLHHKRLVEQSQNVMERIEYIKTKKHAQEVPVRLAHIVCLPVGMGEDHEAKRDSLDADYRAKRDSLEAEIVNHIRPLIPDFRWDGHEIEFR